MWGRFFCQLYSSYTPDIFWRGFTSGGKLIFHIFGALAEFEREIIRERTQAGLFALIYCFSRCVSRERSSGSSANSASRPRNTAVPLVPVLRQYSRRNRCWAAFRSTVIRIGFAGLPCSSGAAVSSAESSVWERGDSRSIALCSLLVRVSRRRRISDAFSVLPVLSSVTLPPLPEALLLPAHIPQDSR
jgi:hypothetical protein